MHTYILLFILYSYYYDFTSITEVARLLQIMNNGGSLKNIIIQKKQTTVMTVGMYCVCVCVV